MIVAGTLPQDTPPQSEVALRKLQRGIRTVTVLTEIFALTPDEAWARMYDRGATDPRYADPDAMDEYLRGLDGIHGDLGQAARNGFTRGWADHRANAREEAER